MDKLDIAILIYIGLSLKIVLIVVALTIHYKMKALPAKGTRKMKRRSDQGMESGHEPKSEGQPAPKTQARGASPKRAVATAEKPMKPALSANQKPSEVQKTVKTASMEGAGISPKRKGIKPITLSPHGKVAQRVEPTGVHKQVQSQGTVPAKAPQQHSALKGSPASTSPGAPHRQLAMPKPQITEKSSMATRTTNTGEGAKKRINPITFSVNKKTTEQIEPTESAKKVESKNIGLNKGTEPSPAIKDISVKSPLPATPMGRYAVSELQGDNKPSAEVSEETLETATTPVIKPGEDNTLDDPSTDFNRPTPTLPEGKSESDEMDKDNTGEPKSGLGDLADLFATSASDFSEKNKLAEQVKDVDVTDILKEGQGLLDNVKKPKEP